MRDQGLGRLFPDESLLCEEVLVLLLAGLGVDAPDPSVGFLHHLQVGGHLHFGALRHGILLAYLEAVVLHRALLVQLAQRRVRVLKGFEVGVRLREDPHCGCLSHLPIRTQVVLVLYLRQYITFC